MAVDLPWIPKSPLPALCGWLSYFRASEMFWTDCILAMGPCVASYGKHIFSLSQESPSVKRPEWGKISPESGLILQLWQRFCALYFSMTHFAAHVLGWPEHQGKGLPWNCLLCRAVFTSTVKPFISYSIRQNHALCLLWVEVQPRTSIPWELMHPHILPGTAEGCAPQDVGLSGAPLMRRGC